MNGTVLDEETSVVDLTHLEFEVPCADPPEAAPHAAEVFVVCRLCNRHVPQCRAHFERMRAWFIMQESAARLMGGHATATCRACLGDAPTFDELVTTVPVKP